ncbi:MAG: phosphatase PAP2 family protein [Clostridiales bacterium]|nr:phosphatase PAP2 family protein [Clostridiales bacterium]
MEQPLNSSKSKLFIIIAALTVFAAIFYWVTASKAGWLDDPVRQLFYSWRNESLTPFVKIITYMGNWQFIGVLCLALLIIKPTRVTYGIPVSIGAALVTLINKVIKHMVARPRPEDILHLIDEGGFSFTSGHSIISMFVYGMLIYLVRRNVENRKLANVLILLLALPMIFIGLSRIYLGVHYPTDVLGGWCLGIAAIVVGSAKV